MAKIAVLGYGTVGSGVVDVLNVNADVIKKNAGEEVEVKKILDIRQFPGDPMEDKIVADFAEIENDPEISVVAEVMGGIEPAYTFTKRALEAGKSVTTSNKALVAEHGHELKKLAEENGVSYLYEASCGGGIPIIRPLKNAITADKILSLGGIFNGTTNFILTKMEKDGGEYADVLHYAQELGYAEKDPSADVDGWDTCRKLAILGSLAYGKKLDYKDIKTEGISAVSQTDIKYAKAFGYRIKLLAVSNLKDDGVFAGVMPVMIGQKNPLYAVDDVFNAVLVKGNMLDDVMFYGQGAGKEPTGSAVVSDIVELVATKGKCNMPTEEEELTVKSQGDMIWRYFVRLAMNPASAAGAFEALGVERGDTVIDIASGECGVITRAMSETAFEKLISKIPTTGRWIRVEDT